MTTKREAVLQALFAALQGVPDATVLRATVIPQRVERGGLIILRDGEPGEPEVTMSPLRYHYEHEAEIEVFVQPDAGRIDEMDDILAAIGVALAVDRRLGGLCDWVEGQAPVPIDLPVEGGHEFRAARVPVRLTYDTTDPLG